MEEKIDYKEKKKEVIISGWHTKPKNPYFFFSLASVAAHPASIEIRKTCVILWMDFTGT